MYNERKLISDFSAHLKKYPDTLPESMALEFKYIKGKTLNFKNHLQPHQATTLIKTQYHQIFYKISDMSQGLKPFDAFFYKRTPAYLAVCFQPPPRKPKVIHFMSANTLASLILQSNTIKEDRFKYYSAFSVKLQSATLWKN